MSIKTNACGTTDTGIRRSHNEDSCHVDNQRGFFLVADGIGGAAAGEVASAIFASSAIETFASSHSRTLSEAQQLINHCFQTANSRILADIAATPSRKGMGCTAELLALHDSGFVLGHVGDSRCYRLRQGTLRQLTSDHSLVQQQIDEGVISREEAKSHPMKNMILRAVGTSSELEVDILQGELVSGDIFLLCTDGLSDMIDDTLIEEVLLPVDSLINKATRLIDLANAAGGRDNVTVTLVGIS